MRKHLALFLSFLHQLALCAWLGGILTVGAVTAPAVFGSAKRAGDTHLGMPLYDFAAQAMGVVFQRFNGVVLVAGAVLLLSGLGYGVLAGMCPKRLGVRAALAALAWGIGAWLAFLLFPQMMAARAGGQVAAFDAMHHQYTHATQAQLLILLGVTALTAWLHLDRGPDSLPRRTEAPSAVPAAVR